MQLLSGMILVRGAYLASFEAGACFAVQSAKPSLRNICAPFSRECDAGIENRLPTSVRWSPPVLKSVSAPPVSGAGSPARAADADERCARGAVAIDYRASV